MRWVWLLLVGCHHHKPALEWVDIDIELPGASADQVEKRVTALFERGLVGVDKLVATRSASTQGLANVSLGFAGDGAELVRGASFAMLPHEALPPHIRPHGRSFGWLVVPPGRADAARLALVRLGHLWAGTTCDPHGHAYHYAIDSARAAAVGSTPLTVYKTIAAANGDPMHASLVADTTKRTDAPRCHSPDDNALVEVRGYADVEPGDGLRAIGTLRSEPFARTDDDTVVAVGAQLTLRGARFADVARAGRAIADRLHVPTRGLATTPGYVPDVIAASRLHVDLDDLGKTIALVYGRGLDGPLSVGSDASVTSSWITASDGAVAVRAADGTLVPLDQVAHRADMPRELLHEGLDAVVLIYAAQEVDVGTLPAGVTATWSSEVDP